MNLYLIGGQEKDKFLNEKKDLKKHLIGCAKYNNKQCLLNSKSENITKCYQGIIDYSQDVSSFYSNFSFEASMGSRGHRFVFCTNPNIIGFTFPSSSLLRSGSKRSYIIICIQEDGVEYCQFGQKYKTFLEMDTKYT